MIMLPVKLNALGEEILRLITLWLLMGRSYGIFKYKALVNVYFHHIGAFHGVVSSQCH